MRLEDRIQHTLRAEAERFQPELATPQDLIPRTIRPRRLVIAGAAAGVAILIGVTALFTRPSPDEPPAHTLVPPSTTTPPPPTTVPEPATTIPYVPPQLVPFIPEPFVADGFASLVVTFPDGSTAELNWPEGLDLMSGGVYPYGWAYIPHVAARDFFIRLGQVEEVVAQFGPIQVLDQYPDGRGGTIHLWRPEGAGVDYLGFQFGEWSVLVYEGGSLVQTPTMSKEQRELWARSFRGETTPEGFLRLYGDEPLRMAIAGDYPSPMSMAFESERGQVELVPEECTPGFVGEGIGTSEFVHWCDRSGLISVRIVGSTDFQQAVYDGLDIGAVHLAGIEGPDANGGYDHLLESWSFAGERWEEAGPADYRLTVTGNMSLMALDFAVLFRDGEATMERGRAWSDPDPPTVDLLFELIEEAVARGDQVSARFDPDIGCPVSIRVDGPGVDDEIGLSIRLEPLSD